MAALSRLKATFEACKSNFRGLSSTFSPKYENIGSPGVACGNSAAAWGAPSHFQRCSLLVSSTKATPDCGKCTSEEHLRQRALCMKAFWSSVKQGENKFFFVKWRWLGQRHWYGLGYMRNAIHWFLHKFNIDLVDTLRAFKAADCLTDDVPCHWSFTQPNTVTRIWHLPQQLWAFPFVMTVSWMVCARSCQPTLRGRVVQEGVSFKADSMADLAAKKVEWWRQNEDNLPPWVGQWRWFFSSSLLLQLLSAFSPYSEQPFLISSRLHSRLCEYQRDAFTTIIAETIMLMCSS